MPVLLVLIERVSSSLTANTRALCARHFSPFLLDVHAPLRRGLPLIKHAPMAEMVDVRDLGSRVERRTGSSPVRSTIKGATP